jgi:hypothetical protein
MILKARGRTSNNQLIAGIREYVIELVRLRYTDFGPCRAAEMLLTKKDGVKVSRETLRKWMVEDGLWLSRKQRCRFHQPCLRRESYGELTQIDGSDHRWFEERGAACSLLVFIDNATGKLMQLRFDDGRDRLVQNAPPARRKELQKRAARRVTAGCLAQDTSVTIQHESLPWIDYHQTSRHLGACTRTHLPIRFYSSG